MMTSASMAKAQEQHDKHLLQLLKIASKMDWYSTAENVTSASHKSPSTEPFFSVQGMKPDPIKIQALQDLPTPQNQKQLQSFLGLVNYLQPFLPRYCTAKTTFLREQVSQWDLDTLNRQCISTIKAMDLQHTSENNYSLL